MLSIHLKVKDFSNEDEAIYKTEEINKENMNKFSIFNADQRLENAKHTTKYYKQTLCNFWGKKNK